MTHSHNFRDARGLYPKIALTREDTPEGRYYNLPNGTKALSVTSVISRNMDSSWLERWKMRVGEQTANEIKTQAGIRGTAVHNIVEQYMTGVPASHILRSAMPANWATFKTLRPALDENVTAVMGVEHPLYSYELNTAGTTDIAAMWKSKKSIIDIKTSRKIKTKEDVPHYLIQACCYAMMWNELYQDNINHLVVLIAVDHEKDPVIIEDSLSNWFLPTRTIFGASNDKTSDYSMPRIMG